jgi:hypothetical protein
MTVSPELILAIAILGLYLKDSVYLLNTNEALLICRGGVNWFAGFGSRSWKIAGKEPYLLNPFLPDQAVFRMRWKMSPSQMIPRAVIDTVISVPRQLVWLGYLAWILWFEIVIVLPTFLTERRGPTVLLATIAVLYSTILVSLALVWIWRQPLGLSNRAFGMLAFECIACAPYAATIVRKISMLHDSSEDFEEAARQRLSTAQWSLVKTQGVARIDEMLEQISEEDPRVANFQQARARLSIPETKSQ